ncbi:MAG: outer membrane protein assembly factor BamA, partial [Candidatus Dadabacteria bacterium]
GNKEVDKDDIKEALELKSGDFFDKKSVEKNIEKIVSMYQGKGYYDADITYSVVPAGTNQIDLTLAIKEGEKFKIKKIVFEGVEKLDPDDLRSAIQTKRYKWWSSWLFGTGRLNKEMLENDRIILRQQLLDHGFLEGTVSAPIIRKEDKHLIITFVIKEGPQYKVGNVTAEGDLIDSSVQKTLEGIKLKEGDIFNSSLLRSDSLLISDKFADIGYAFVNVIPDTRIKRKEKIVDVIYKINKGKLTKVGLINITGNKKTYDNVIRRELEINEGDIYSVSKIKRSKQLIERRGYFEEVNITTQSTDKDNEVNLLVNVKEGSTGAFSIGAGVSSEDGFLFNSRISENNIFGTGRRVNLNVDLGQERDNYNISFYDPRINDTQWSGGVDLLRTQRVFPDFDRSQTGGAISGGYPLKEFFGEWAEDVRFSLRYQYMSVEISNVNELDAAQLVIDQQGKTTVSSIVPTLSRNTINNPLNPTEGSRQSFSVEYAGLGGDENFLLFIASNQLYIPIWKPSFGDVVFSWRTKFGWGETLNGERFPLFRRFFPGGINSVRGFKTRTMGPKDENGNEFGGSKQLVNNLELIFPLIPSAGLKGVVFYDFGNAFDDSEPISVDGLRHAAGYGIRWTSPLGPIRIEFGFPLDRKEGERRSVTLFSFGAPL